MNRDLEGTWHIPVGTEGIHQNPVTWLKFTLTTSFQILSNSLFTDHPTIRRYIV
jgi:hypothetical protein